MRLYALLSAIAFVASLGAYLFGDWQLALYLVLVAVLFRPDHWMEEKPKE